MKKILKKLSPLVLIIFLALSYSYSQDEKSEDSSDKTKSEVLKKDNTDEVEESSEEVESDSESDSENGSELQNDTEVKNAENKDEPIKKNEVVKKEITAKKNYNQKREINEFAIKLNKGLLRISPGDSLLERIPGIKLANNKKSEKIKDIVPIPDSLEEADGVKKTTGSETLLWFSKEKTEIIAQISIVLLILLVFVLYKFRSGKPGRRV